MDAGDLPSVGGDKSPNRADLIVPKMSSPHRVPAPRSGTSRVSRPSGEIKHFLVQTDGCFREIFPRNLDQHSIMLARTV